MQTFKCIHKEKNGNSVTAYVLSNCNDGSQLRLEPNELKKRIKVKQINVVNLQLTKDNRLIDRNESQVDGLIEQYLESCKLLGIKPLTIQIIKNKYVVTEIPKGEHNINIPYFVDAIMLNQETKGKDTGSVRSSFISNNEIASTLQQIIRKTNNIEDNTNKIAKNTEDIENNTNKIAKNTKKNNKMSNREVEDIKNKFNSILNKIDTVDSNINNITALINNVNSQMLESASFVADLSSIAIDSQLYEVPEELLKKSRITNKDLIDTKSKLIALNNNCLTSKESYDKVQQRLYGDNKYINYSKINEIVPYINYASNVYENMNSDLMLRLNINDDIIPDNTLTKLDMIFTFLGAFGTVFGLAAAFNFPAIEERIIIGSLGAGAANSIGSSSGGLAADIIKLANTSTRYDNLKFARKDARKLSKEFNADFKPFMDILDNFRFFIDKHIFVFVLQCALLNTTDYIPYMNKSGFFDRAIIKTLAKLRGITSINYIEIAPIIKACYLAACIYVDENYTFNNDLYKLNLGTNASVDEVTLNENNKKAFFNIISEEVKVRTKRIKDKRTEAENYKYEVKFKITCKQEEKAAYLRQRFYYGFMIHWFEIAMYKCNVKQTVVEIILNIFKEEAEIIGLKPYLIDSNSLNETGIGFDMSSKIREELRVLELK